MKRTFNRFSQSAANAVGSYWAFFIAVILVLIWILTGPLFHFSDTWQLMVNSITNVATFLIVFLIQHTQNEDTKALRIKLDELIRRTKKLKKTRNDIKK